MTQQPPVVEGFDRTARGVETFDQLVDLATRTLVAEDSGPGQLDLIFVDPQEIAELNQTHMGHQGPTDVLAFPLDADGADLFASLDESGPLAHVGHIPADLGDVPVHLGDVVICPEVAEAQAPDHCGDYNAELSLLVIHGVLHVLGHDHAEPDETAVMQERERSHMAAQGFEHPRWSGPDSVAAGSGGSAE